MITVGSRDRPISFFETDIFIFFFTDIWPVADILLTTDTDIFADILTKYFG